jgi:hypothetical protein
VILAFTGERMFISTKNQKKPAAALVKAYICQFLAILSKSISCDSPFNKENYFQTISKKFLPGTMKFQN